MTNPICPYCNMEAERITGAQLWPHRPDLASKVNYRCVPCDASVGCHPGTEIALGSLAKPALRKARADAHAAFDRLWRAKIRRDGVSKRKSRGAAYGWLSDQLGLTRDECHIGMFDEATCARAVEICRPFHDARAA